MIKKSDYMAKIRYQYTVSLFCQTP